MQKLKDKMIGAYVRATTRLHCLREEGQGTTEYAILVGVLAAIAAFRGKISELWEVISSGVNGL